MNPIHELHKLGQSVWFDNIERRILENGELASMVENGIIRGVTSNPSIFNNAISNSKDYDGAIIPLAKGGNNKVEIYEALVIEDIQAACDLFAPLFQKTKGEDGYVSLEVSPYLADNTKGTIDDARRLWGLVDRPNLMIKIPATIKGLPAVTQVIADGINVNVTLIFSIERYQKVMDAYLTGLERRLESGETIGAVTSVSSFFVSRIDTKIDGWIQEQITDGRLTTDQGNVLFGKIAVASAKLAYVKYKEVFHGERFGRLKEKGGRIQKALWASTSAKNPEYPDTKYVDDLIGPDTINTIPPNTLDAFGDHGTAKLTLEEDVPAAQSSLDYLASIGISLAKATKDLEKQGVQSFADAYSALLESVEKRRLAVT
jgi:transaldolase